MTLGFQHNAGKDSAGMDAEAAGREEGGGVFDGADRGNGDAGRGDASGEKLEAVAFWEVDVPLLLMAADRLHVKACGTEGVVDLIAHLETVEADARAYLHFHVFGT